VQVSDRRETGAPVTIVARRRDVLRAGLTVP